ncbi:hypothetical protein KC726_00370 [Candidatus Woesebacteria bacterium]|nr:hypothetical protein [Candidatus Woesebacteria bacterium]
MKNVLIIGSLIVIILGIVYTGYTISNGEDPLAALNSSATGKVQEPPQTPQDLLANASPDQNGEPVKSPTPSIEYTSTSPTPENEPTSSPTPTIVEDGMTKGGLLPSPSPTEEPTPTLIPTVVEELPVAGVNDYFLPASLTAGVIFMVVALAL